MSDQFLDVRDRWVLFGFLLVCFWFCFNSLLIKIRTLTPPSPDPVLAPGIFGEEI